MLDKLCTFDTETRLHALRDMARKTDFPTESPQVNMHMHTFFSYNGEGWSPARIAFEMKKLGVHAAAICDFDVLQGLPEFILATDHLKLRAAVGFEVRTFFQEYADQEINSPGEPGVFYFMGMGFVNPPKHNSQAEATLNAMLRQSHHRNRSVIHRINAHLNDFQLDYDQDVLPLTPSRNATERHICLAFHQKALAVYGSHQQAAKAWANILSQNPQEVETLIQNQNAFTDFLRSKLIKRGGLGYQKPTTEAFPPLPEVIDMILQCRAIPMSAWLDGSLPGEQNPEQQLNVLKEKGVAAVNVIPDRNWNFKDKDKKAEKVKALNKYIELATRMGLPVNVGTEANKPGQRLVDDFQEEALKPHLETFIKGAQIMVGHTRLLRFANLSHTDRHFDAAFKSVHHKNDFFAAVGALPAPEQKTINALLSVKPAKAYDIIVDSARKQSWTR